jgi:hypothetical protein
MREDSDGDYTPQASPDRLVCLVSNDPSGCQYGEIHPLAE